MICLKKKSLMLGWFLFLVLVTNIFSPPIHANVLGKLINNISSNGDQLCDEINCFFPSKRLVSEDVVIKEQIDWNKDKNLVLHTKGNIIFEKEGKITSKNNGSVFLKSGMEPGKKETYDGTVVFKGDSPQVEMIGNGEVKIYYNPIRGKENHKYHNSNHYLYEQYVKTTKNNNLSTYMLVNNVADLQHIRSFLSGSYALSQDIDATETKNWFGGKGFIPLKNKSKENMPFSGNFDGNNYSIKNLFMNRPDEEEEVGLFGRCQGRNILHNVVENLILIDFDITGGYYVGSLAGSAINSDLLNIKVINPKISGINTVGGLVGSSFKVQAQSIQVSNVDIVVTSGSNKGSVVGGAGQSTFNVSFKTNQLRDEVLNKYNFIGKHDNQTKLCVESGERTICLNFVDRELEPNVLMVTNTSKSMASIDADSYISNTEMVHLFKHFETVLHAAKQ